MRISYNWLKQYIEIDKAAADVAELLTSTGLEVEGLEHYKSVEVDLDGVVTGEVLTCTPHPNADKLSLTTVNVGTEETLPIVCGAPNVAAGQKVLVATVGAQLPDGKGGTFTIKKAKIRGEASAGMICAEDELGLGDNHDGIMVLPEDVPVGIAAMDYLDVYTDHVFEIGLTPNRSDANGHIGVARDLVAVMKVHHQAEGKLIYPDLSQFKEDNSTPPIQLEIRNSDACPRYAGICLENVKVGPSPKWLKDQLEAIGQRSVNNVVDITNYVLHEYGQPLHAFDADKIKGGKVIVSTLEEGTVFTTLDEVDRKLSREDLMICDGDTTPMCIGGVFGGIKSGVTQSTSRIFLESAHFDPISIRRTSTRHNLRTDAARCFEKGTDPNICIDALKRAVILLETYAGAKVNGSIVDHYPKPVKMASIDFSVDHFNRATGLALTEKEVVDILEALEMKVEKGQNTLTVWVPTNKPDVTRPADLIEEVLRIYGLDNVPVSSKFSYSANIKQRPDKNETRDRLADYLSSRGFNEMMSMSITQSSFYKKILPGSMAKLVYINNTSNVQLDIMRPDLLISALEAVVYNLNRKQNHLRLFEFGAFYEKIDDGYMETESLCLAMTGDITEANWKKERQRHVDFFDLKAEVEAMLMRVGLQQWQEREVDRERFSFALHYYRGPLDLVHFGKVRRQLCEEMGIKQDLFVALFNWDNVFKAVQNQKIHVKPISRFPDVKRDLALVLDKKVRFADVAQVAKKTEKKLLEGVSLFDVYENEEQLGKHKKSYAITLTLSGQNKTLSEKEIEQCVSKLIKAFENQLGAHIRK